MWNETLFNAVRQGDIADILLCLENGADVNFMNRNKYTAIWLAKTDEIKEYLIGVGAEKLNYAFEPPRNLF